MDEMFQELLKTESSGKACSLNTDASECGIPVKVRVVTKRRKIYKQIRPKVSTEWSHDDIVKLINAVKERPALWDISSPQYKLSKTQAWEEVAKFVGEQTVDECKAKWSNLRVTFKTNLSKSKIRKSVLHASGEFVVWKYFKLMLFLDAHESNETREPASLKSLLGEKRNSSIAENEQKRCRKTQSIPSTQTDEFPSSNSDLLKEIAAKVICQIADKTETKDQFDIFGAYIAAELRTLPPSKGIIAKRKLASALINIMDDVERP